MIKMYDMLRKKNYLYFLYKLHVQPL